jgi:hypothetical protein
VLKRDDRINDPVFGGGWVIYQGISERTHRGYLLADFDARGVGLRAYSWDDIGLLDQTALEIQDALSSN